jgi:uncharacterized repeat protein (TIGR01451 family)
MTSATSTMTHPWRAALVTALAALASLALGAPAPAVAQQSPTFLVTYAARACPTYQDVTANLARNDIQESLQDLGADTLYTSGEAISPAKEALGQPNCTPLVNWRFRLGTGFQSHASQGPWGSLSAVSGAYAQPVPTTLASIPLLDSQGNDTGQTLAGAVTVPLTAEQAQRASQSSSLWVQGGEIDDPVLNTPFPGQYGFAALRCAIDNLNGDNVEYVAYPQGATHVFCFAYYVQPPPTSGTIIVRKVVDDPAATADQTFTYAGNISYNSSGTFTLNAHAGQDGSTTFFRAAGSTWTFQEEALDGWSLTGLACTSATGASTTTTDLASGATSVALGSGDTVTCTYTNRLTPPPGGLTLSKVTAGGIGRFPFTVTGPQTAHQTLTTRRPLRPVSGAPLSLQAGTYRVTEQLPPPTRFGSWRSLGAICNGARVRGATSISVTLRAGAGSRCAFANRFVPAGRITLRKTTLGGTGTVSFLVSAVREPSRTFQQTATTTTEGTPVRATGDSMRNVALGAYDITEASAGATTGRWTLDYVLCNGKPLGAEQGRIRVVLTSRTPRVDCTFVDQRVDQPVPPQPAPNPAPTPAPTPGGDVAGLIVANAPSADLAVTKTVSPSVAQPGQPVRYTVVVTNGGADTANDVVAAELSPPSQRRLSISTTRGTCRGDRPARCAIGTLAPGQRATITVSTTARAVPGVVVNRVAVASSSRDPVLANNIDAARLVVIRPQFTG